MTVTININATSTPCFKWNEGVLEIHAHPHVLYSLEYWWRTLPVQAPQNANPAQILIETQQNTAYVEALPATNMEGFVKPMLMAKAMLSDLSMRGVELQPEEHLGDFVRSNVKKYYILPVQEMALAVIHYAEEILREERAALAKK